MRLPDGSSAAGVPVNIKVSSGEQWHGTTDQEGAVFPVFNIRSAAQITVEVSILIDKPQHFPLVQFNC